MKARSEKGEKTRLRILQAAGDLFHAQGVAATSPDQVIEASETGKGQFYHYFKSKEGLVHAVLQNYLEEIHAGNNPAYFEIKGWKDLERFFFIHLELQKSFDMTRGCPFGTIGNGVTEKDELVRQDLDRFRVQPADDGAWGSCGREQSEPRSDFEIRQPRFGHRRHVGPPALAHVKHQFA